MMDKAKKRQREDDKETIFMYGGRQWAPERVEKSASRAKKARMDEDSTGEHITPVDMTQ